MPCDLGRSLANIYGSSVAYLENTRLSTQPFCYINNIEWVKVGPWLCHCARSKWCVRGKPKCGRFCNKFQIMFRLLSFFTVNPSMLSLLITSSEKKYYNIYLQRVHFSYLYIYVCIRKILKALQWSKVLWWSNEY